MTFRDVLSSEIDLGSFGSLARQGFRWWIGELAGLLPRAWREGLSTQPRFFVEPLPEGNWRVWRNGRAISEGESTIPAGTKVGLTLPPGSVLVREIATPRISLADVRRMIGLDIERLSPLPADQIVFDCEIADREAEDGGQRVSLGIVPRDVAGDAVAKARSIGLRPVRVSARTAADPESRRFDFLSAIVGDRSGKRHASEDMSGRRSRPFLS